MDNVKTSKTYSGEESYNVVGNLIIIRYLYKKIKEYKAAKEQETQVAVGPNSNSSDYRTTANIYDFLSISRQRFYNICFGQQFFLDASIRNHLCACFGIKEDYFKKENAELLEFPNDIKVSAGVLGDVPSAGYWAACIQSEYIAPISGKKILQLLQISSDLVPAPTSSLPDIFFMYREKRLVSNSEKDKNNTLRVFNPLLDKALEDLVTIYFNKELSINSDLFKICYYFDKGYTYNKDRYWEHIILDELSEMKFADWENIAHGARLDEIIAVLDRQCKIAHTMLDYRNYKNEQ